jgi:hypothetical protein
MDMRVTVPLYLLEDIFRLLIYLDHRADRDDSRFHKSARDHRFQHDTALWELKLKIKRLQGQIVETYLMTFYDVNDEERLALRDWVASGESVYDNPCHYCDKKGNPMDYISAMRDLDEQLEERGLSPNCLGHDDEMPWPLG